MPLSQASAAALASLRRGFDADLFLDDADLIGSYSVDRTGDYSGEPLAVARPRSTQEVSQILKRCAELGVAVAPQGGLTGLVGAAAPDPVNPELVVRLDRMNRVRAVDPVAYSMVVEAGCVLETAKAAAEDAECLLPITFGAQGSCRIGGNVSTNAGGFNVLRYGMTRDLVLGLEVALPDGRVGDGLRTLRKDNRGYDLKQLFIGAEGTLGVVTAAALKLFPKPTQVQTALLALGSVDDAMTLYAKARRGCSDLLSAFEIMLRRGMELGLAHKPALSDPIGGAHPVYVLIELSAGGAVDLEALLQNFLESATDLVVDGVIASSQARAEKLWALREAMVEAQSRAGSYYRTDVSVPISRIASFLEATLAELARAVPAGAPIAYGHIGDGNIHLNVVPPAHYDKAQRKALFAQAEETIFAFVDKFHGSISAEHGVGRSKKKAFLRRVDPVTLDLMRRVKAAIDPAGLMSPGRIFDM